MTFFQQNPSPQGWSEKTTHNIDILKARFMVGQLIFFFFFLVCQYSHAFFIIMKLLFSWLIRPFLLSYLFTVFVCMCLFNLSRKGIHLSNNKNNNSEKMQHPPQENQQNKSLGNSLKNLVNLLILCIACSDDYLSIYTLLYIK